MKVNYISRTLVRWLRRIPKPVRSVWVVAIYLISWAALDKVALAFETTPEISVWYPPSALDFVLLLVFGLQYSPALLLNTLVHDYVVTGRNLGFVTLWVFNLVTTLGYAGACALLLLKLRINPRLRQLRDVVWFVIVATLAAPLVVALLQAINFAQAGMIPWSKLLIYTLHYWAGDATGIAMLAPVLLIGLRKVPWVWSHAEQEPNALEKAGLRWPTRQEASELLLESITLSWAILVSYGTRLGANLDYTYLVFLPLIWIAMRHGLERAAVTVLFINVGVAFLVRARIGESNIFALQFGLMAISLLGLLLGSVATARRQADKSLRYAAKRLESLQELDRAILAARSLDKIAQVALHSLLQLIPCQRASIVMFDLQEREFTLLAVHVNDGTLLEPLIERFPLQDFGDILALGRGEVNMVQDVLSCCDLPPGSQAFLGEGVRAYMNVPLLAAGELMGALNLGKDSPGAFKPNMVNVVREVANQLAIAIQQARLFSFVEQQATRERSLNQISRALNSSLDPKQILQEIVQLTGECFSVERVIIYTTGAEQIQVINEWRVNDQIVSMLDYRSPLSEWPGLVDPTSKFYCRRIFHAPDYAAVPQTPARRMQIQQLQILSVLSAPIFIRGKLFGGLCLHTTTSYRTFTDDEIHLLERIADQAAIALYNAQSYERLEQLVKERTQELEQEKLFSDAANRAKSEFLSNMSHELRTPLTGILGFSSILLEEIFGPLNAKQQQYIEIISTSGKHLLELINDLLDLSKIEAGREELILETILVEEVASACMSLIQERAHSRGLQLSLLIAPNATTCIADKRRLKQILFNLLSNAVKFTESGSVTLKVEQTEEEIQFSVIDTGIGIAQAELLRLFQPFQQLDSGLNRKYEGTGLGLALSRKLAQLHGGDITLQSELGCGSCFTLHLPVQPFSNRVGVGAGGAS